MANGSFARKQSQALSAGSSHILQAFVTEAFAFLTKAEDFLQTRTWQELKESLCGRARQSDAVPQVYAPVLQRKIEIDVGRHKLRICTRRGCRRDKQAVNAECLLIIDQCENVAKACAEKHVDGVET